MKHAFVLPCYFQRENPVVINAVKSIRTFHPDSPIIIIDSGSSDKSYYKDLEAYSVIIEDVNNKNYDTGAYWYAYTKYTDIEFFYFIHDSIELYDNLFDLFVHDITSIRYFNSANIVGGRYVISGRSDFIKKYILSKLGRLDWLNDIYGCNNSDQLEWIHEQMKRIRYWIPDFFPALFGPMMCVKREVMDRLANAELNKILPTNKNEQMAMERIFGIALMQEGYDFVNNSLQGDQLANQLDTSRFNKIILNRS
ncbi:MAG: hypothetical protein WA099_11700 [Sulfuricurvum sp.]